VSVKSSAGQSEQDGFIYLIGIESRQLLD